MALPFMPRGVQRNLGASIERLANDPALEDMTRVIEKFTEEPENNDEDE
jgi:hypothetical protein